MSSVRSRKGSVLCTGINLKNKRAPSAGSDSRGGFVIFSVLEDRTTGSNGKQQDASRMNRGSEKRDEKRIEILRRSATM